MDECDCQAEIETAIAHRNPGRAEYLAARCDMWHPKQPQPPHARHPKETP